jgi:tRNA threonylcarbamoyladenosine biosynthesis protein TsaE
MSGSECKPDRAQPPRKMISTSEAETFRIGRELAESLTLPAHLLLYGDLGAGKTAFSRGLAAGFGLEETDEVTSPTFTLINQYRPSEGGPTIYHIDLYRIEAGRPGGGLDGLGLDEIFDNPNAAVIVEWAERLGDFQTPGALQVFLYYVDEGSRKLEVRRVF